MIWRLFDINIEAYIICLRVAVFPTSIPTGSYFKHQITSINLGYLEID